VASSTGGFSAANLSQDRTYSNFENYDENEEATCIKRLTFIKFSPLFAYLVTPFLCLCTGLIFALVLYWVPTLRAKFLYTKVNDIKWATHLIVEGKDVKTYEIVKLTKSTSD